MKKLQNNFTTPEQSKQLLELGLPKWTADMAWEPYCTLPRYVQPFLSSNCCDSMDNPKFIAPCWSVGRLIEIYNECNSLADEYKTRYGVNIIEDIIRNFETPYSFTHCIEFDFSKLEEWL